jgi:hypothetical protein
MATTFNWLLCCPYIEFLTSEGDDGLLDAFVSWLKRDIDTIPTEAYGGYPNTHTPVFSEMGRMDINSRQAQGFNSSGTGGNLRTRNLPTNHPLSQMSPIHSHGIQPAPSGAQGSGGHHVARISPASNPTTYDRSPRADNNHSQASALGARHRDLSSGRSNPQPRNTKSKATAINPTSSNVTARNTNIQRLTAVPGNQNPTTAFLNATSQPSATHKLPGLANNQSQPTATSSRNNPESGRRSSANATAYERKRRRLEINNSNEDDELDRELDNADGSLNDDMGIVPCIGQQTYSGYTANGVSRAAMNSTVVNASRNPPVRRHRQNNPPQGAASAPLPSFENIPDVGFVNSLSQPKGTQTKLPRTSTSESIQLPRDSPSHIYEIVVERRPFQKQVNGPKIPEQVESFIPIPGAHTATAPMAFLRILTSDRTSYLQGDKFKIFACNRCHKVYMCRIRKFGARVGRKDEVEVEQKAEELLEEEKYDEESMKYKRQHFETLRKGKDEDDSVRRRVALNQLHEDHNVFFPNFQVGDPRIFAAPAAAIATSATSAGSSPGSNRANAVNLKDNEDDDDYDDDYDDDSDDDMVLPTRTSNYRPRRAAHATTRAASTAAPPPRRPVNRSGGNGSSRNAAIVNPVTNDTINVGTWRNAIAASPNAVVAGFDVRGRMFYRIIRQDATGNPVSAPTATSTRFEDIIFRGPYQNMNAATVRVAVDRHLRLQAFQRP